MRQQLTKIGSSLLNLLTLPFYQLSFNVLVVFVQIEFRVRDRLALKKKRGENYFFVCKKKFLQIQMRQILASFSHHKI